MKGHSKFNYMLKILVINCGILTYKVFFQLTKIKEQNFVYLEYGTFLYYTI